VVKPKIKSDPLAILVVPSTPPSDDSSVSRFFVNFLLKNYQIMSSVDKLNIEKAGSSQPASPQPLSKQILPK